MIPLGPGTLVGQRRSGWVRQAPRVELRLESAAPRIFSGGPADTRDRVFEISGIGSFAAIRAVPRTGPGSGPANAATPNITPSSPRSATLCPETDSRGLPGPCTERYAVATRSRLPEHGLYNRAIAGRPGVHVGTLKPAPKAVGDAATGQTYPRPFFGGCPHTLGATIARRWVCGTALLVPTPFNVGLPATWRHNTDGREEYDVTCPMTGAAAPWRLPAVPSPHSQGRAVSRWRAHDIVTPVRGERRCPHAKSEIPVVTKAASGSPTHQRWRDVLMSCVPNRCCSDAARGSSLTRASESPLSPAFGVHRATSMKPTLAGPASA